MNDQIRTFLVPVLWCCGLAFAAPSTKPTSPEEFQRIYTDALNAQDAALVRSLFLTGTPGQRAVAEVFVEQELATAKLAKAIEKAFGVALWGGGELVPADPAQWRIVGDHAIHLGEDVPRPAPLTKGADGIWRIDLWRRGIDWADDAEKSREVLELCADEVKELRAVTKAVDAGEFRSAKTAAHAAVVLGPALTPRPGAPATRPAQRPGTRPVKVDLSSPRACVQTYGHALMEGDAATILHILHAADAQQEESSKALAEWAAASARFFVVAARRFGTEAAEDLELPIPEPYYDGLGLLYPAAEDGVQFEIKDGEASCRGFDCGSGQFVRVGGEWKMRAWPKDKEFPRQELEGTAILRAAARIRRQLADRIEAGELKDLDAVIRAIPKLGPQERD